MICMRTCVTAASLVGVVFKFRVLLLDKIGRRFQDKKRLASFGVHSCWNSVRSFSLALFQLEREALT